MTSSRSKSPVVFCDYLDVTFAPHDCPAPELRRFFLEAGLSLASGSAERKAEPSFSQYVHTGAAKHERGSLTLELTPRWARVSASGSVCAFFRERGLWLEYLSLLSSSPHTVTRVDCTLDLAMDGALLVDSMRKRYADGTVKLSRKAIPTSVLLAVRPADGRETGTWYAGQRTRARVTAKVYDKAWQMLSKFGLVTPPWARVEVTVKTGFGATLRDAAEPTALFWHVASPALLQAPEGISMWTPDTEAGWVAPARAFDPAALLRRRVESLSELDALAEVADSMGPSGREYLLHLIQKRLRAPVGVSEAV